MCCAFSSRMSYGFMYFVVKLKLHSSIKHKWNSWEIFKWIILLFLNLHLSLFRYLLILSCLLLYLAACMRSTYLAPTAWKFHQNANSFHHDLKFTFKQNMQWTRWPLSPPPPLLFMLKLRFLCCRPHHRERSQLEFICWLIYYIFLGFIFRPKIESDTISKLIP